jgi:hypothetical protein
MNWFRLAKYLGEQQATEQEMREVSPDAKGSLKGVHYSVAFDQMLSNPQIVDEDKLIRAAMTPGATASSYAKTAYYEAFNGFQRAQKISGLINSKDPQKIKEHIREQALQGVLYDPSDPNAREHELRHEAGGSMTVDQLVSELASSIQSDVPEEVKRGIAGNFMQSWVSNRMKLYDQKDWNDELFAMQPEIKGEFLKSLSQMQEQLKAYQKPRGSVATPDDIDSLDPKAS